MTSALASTVVDRASETLGAFLPRLVGAIALLLIGLVLAWLVGRIVARATEAAGLDGAAERVHVRPALQRAGIARPPSTLLGTAVRLALSVIVVVAAISALGLDALSDSLNAAVLFLPKLFAAAALVLAGIALGRFARTRVEESGDRMDLAGPLGPLVEAGLIAVFVSTALAELSVPLAIVTVMVAILVAAVAFGAALAFGLGSRDTARQLAAGRSLTTPLRVGQTISVEGLRGEITAFESAATLLRAEGGETLRMPNQLLADSVVTVHPDPSAGPPAAAVAPG